MRTHVRVAGLLGPARTECIEASAVVEQLRLMWRPKRPRVILLAESHVWTTREEAESVVVQPDGVATRFARFIYCLGGGEPQLVSPPVRPNVGAPQYWRLLHDCVRGPAWSHVGLLKSGEPNAPKRVTNKLALLCSLREVGIWLVDASVVALYRAGERLAHGALYEAVLRNCWDGYVGALMREASPSVVIVVGRQVDSAIGGIARAELGPATRFAVIKQPNAHLSAAELQAYRSNVFELTAEALSAETPEVLAASAPTSI